jgi:hypothetical protein
VEEQSASEKVKISLELLQDIKRSGHLIGSHTLRHHVHDAWAENPEELRRLREIHQNPRLYFESMQAMIKNIEDGKKY